MNHASIPPPGQVALVDWSAWQPAERAVLCFIHNGDDLLLIHKKTGLGTGKVNAPGGRIDPGESAEQAAVREPIEEVGLTPHNLRKVGELHFIFTDGYSLHGTVFFADSFSGTLCETDEADPFWCHRDRLPYDQMWEDDRYWLPDALAGRFFMAYFIFDGDRMVDKEVRTFRHPPWPLSD